MKRYLPMAVLIAAVGSQLVASSQSLCFDPASDVLYASGNGPTSAATGDFDEDNNRDVVVANYLEASFSILSGNGDGTFAQALIVAANTPTEVEVADLDGDGHDDLVWSNISTSPVMFRAGNGDGTFGDVITSYITGFDDSFRQHFTLADVTGDGDLDAIVNEFDQDKLHILEGNGDGTFTLAQTLTTLDQPLDVEFGDFNNDGDVDVICGYNYNLDNVSLFMNNGSGTLMSGTAITAGTAFYFYLEVADFDNDNNDDIAVTGLTNMHILTGNGNGTFDPAINLSMQSYGADVVANDFDDDGNMDLAWADEGGGNIGVLMSNGNATFDPTNFNSSHGQPRDLVEDDFDEDGVLDIIGINYLNDNVSFLKGNDDGTFGSGMLDSNGFVNSLGAGDVNDDGNLDIAVANNGGGISLLIGNGDGTFDDTQNFITQYGFEDVALADVNGDNNDDIIALQGSTYVAILISNGNGTFDPEVNYEAGTNAGGDRQLEVADLNGDGYPDIAASYIQEDYFSVLMNNGNGTFAAQVTYTTGDYPYDIHATDYDGDGDKDIFVAAYNDNQLNFFRNNGNGTFTPIASFDVGTTPVSITSGDWNNDGDTDLACVNSNSMDITILIQPDGIGFPIISTIPMEVNSNPMEVVSGDVNGDGDADLVVALYAMDQAGVLFGNGDGTFQALVAYNVEQSPQDVALGDFNNDGALDISSGNHGSQNVSVILNNSIYFLTSGPTDFCEGESVALGVITNGSEEFTYAWSNGATTDQIVVTESGDYTVLVTNQNGNCTLVSPVVSVNVLPSTIDVNLDLSFVGNVCADGASFPLQGGSPQGGTYSGSGVSNDVFDPSDVSAGTYTISYTYVDAGGCATGTATDDLVVNALPIVTIDFPVDTVCIEDGNWTISGGSPAGGDYFGEYIVFGTFDPAASGEGLFDIHYTYTDGNGCTNEAEEQILVDMCTGVGESVWNEFSVYPSATHSSFTIEGNQGFTFSVMDSFGKLLLEENETGTRTVVHFENYSAGLYLVKVSAGEQSKIFRIEKLK